MTETMSCGFAWWYVFNFLCSGDMYIAGDNQAIIAVASLSSAWTIEVVSIPFCVRRMYEYWEQNKNYKKLRNYYDII